MAKGRGVVLEVRNHRAVVLDETGLFRHVSAEGQDWQAGDEIWVDIEALALGPKRAGAGSWLRGRPGLRARGWAVAVACALLIAIGVPLGYQAVVSAQTVAVVTFDVNPSVELDLNGAAHVLRAIGLDADGQSLLGHVHVRGVPLATALTELTDAAAAEGFVSKTVTVPIVIAAAPAGAAALPPTVTQAIQKVQKSSTAAMAKAGYHVQFAAVSAPRSDQQEARALHLSLGRYLIYRQAKRAGLTVTPADLRGAPIVDALRRAGASAPVVKEVLQGLARLDLTGGPAAPAKDTGAPGGPRGPGGKPAAGPTPGGASQGQGHGRGKDQGKQQRPGARTGSGNGQGQRTGKNGGRAPGGGQDVGTGPGQGSGQGLPRVSGPGAGQGQDQGQGPGSGQGGGQPFGQTAGQGSGQGFGQWQGQGQGAQPGAGKGQPSPASAGPGGGQGAQGGQGGGQAGRGGQYGRGRSASGSQGSGRGARFTLATPTATASPTNQGAAQAGGSPGQPGAPGRGQAHEGWPQRLWQDLQGFFRGRQGRTQGTASGSRGPRGAAASASAGARQRGLGPAHGATRNAGQGGCPQGSSGKQPSPATASAGASTGCGLGQHGSGRGYAGSGQAQSGNGRRGH